MSRTKSTKHPLEERLRQLLKQRGELSSQQCVLAAVSGGADSMALLGLLDALADKLEWQLEVVHFDHGLRVESAVDAEWVQQLSERLGRMCHVQRTKHLAGMSAGVQAAGRKWREKEMQQLVSLRKAAWAASGHQREDQLETLLMQWLRGVHAAHWRGIAWRHGVWLRPLLEFRRQELVAYLHYRGWSWREDASNRCWSYRRNRLRHQVLNTLEELSGGGLEARLLAAREHAFSWETWIDSLPPLRTSAPQAKQYWLEVDSLLAWPPPVQSEGLRRFIQQQRAGRLEACHLHAVMRLLQQGKLQWQLHLPAGRLLRRVGPKLWLENLTHTATWQQVGSWKVLALDDLPLFARVIDSTNVYRLVPPRYLRLENLPENACFTLRYAKPGDRFQPPHRSKPLKLTEWLRQQGIPAWQRPRWPVLAWQPHSFRTNNAESTHRIINPKPLVAIAPNLPCHRSPTSKQSSRTALEIQLNHLLSS